MNSASSSEENDALQALKILQSMIDSRITMAEQIVQRYKASLQILRKEQEKLQKESKVSTLEPKSAGTDESIRTNCEDFIESSQTSHIMPSLSKILTQAREMRTMTQRLQIQQRKTDSADAKRRSQSEKVRATKEVKRVVSKRHEQKEKSDTKIQNDDLIRGLTAHQETKSMPPCAGRLLEELKQLSRHKVTPVSCLLGTSKELFESQSALLSKLCGRAKFPVSVPFQLVLDSLEHKEEPTPPNSKHRQDPISKTDELCMRSALVTAIQKERQAFDRVLKSKLLRVVPKQLSKADIEEILLMWYRSRRLIQIYENIVAKEAANLESEVQQKIASSKRVQSSGTKTESVILHAVDKMPLLTPLLVRGKLSSPSAITLIKSADWLAGSLRSIDDFHSNLQVRAKYAIETLIGKYDLRDVIRELKRCCEMEATASCRSETLESRRRKWIRALNLYRDIYCSLTTEAQNFTSCMFIEKS